LVERYTSTPANAARPDDPSWPQDLIVSMPAKVNGEDPAILASGGSIHGDIWHQKTGPPRQSMSLKNRHISFFVAAARAHPILGADF
jgi:hypothetical protein